MLFSWKEVISKQVKQTLHFLITNNNNINKWYLSTP